MITHKKVTRYNKIKTIWTNPPNILCNKGPVVLNFYFLCKSLDPPSGGALPL